MFQRSCATRLGSVLVFAFLMSGSTALAVDEAELQKQINQLRAQLKDAENRAAVAETTSASAKAAIANAQAKIDDANATIANANAKIKDADATIANANAAMKNAEAKVKAAEDKLNAATGGAKPAAPTPGSTPATAAASDDVAVGKESMIGEVSQDWISKNRAELAKLIVSLERQKADAQMEEWNVRRTLHDQIKAMNQVHDEATKAAPGVADKAMLESIDAITDSKATDPTLKLDKAFKDRYTKAKTDAQAAAKADYADLQKLSKMQTQLTYLKLILSVNDALDASLTDAKARVSSRK